MLTTKLTQREKQVLACFAQGLDKKQVGLKLIVAYGTINYHLNNIYIKTGTSNILSALVTTDYIEPTSKAKLVAAQI